MPVESTEPATPYLLVDTARLRANIARMQGRVKELGADLRPHFKTHRSRWVAEIQLEAGAIGVTCATRGQVHSASSITDSILVSGPLQLDSGSASVLRDAHDDGMLYAASSAESLIALRRVLGPDVTANVLLEVDVGCDRGGLDPEECVDRARQAHNLGLRVLGALAYPGQGYEPSQQAEAAAAEHQLLDATAAHLTRGGFDVRYLSAGSSPTMAHSTSGVATEYRPGTYAFGDAQQVELGSVAADDVALTVVSTVIAHRDSQVVLDAGGKSVGRDSPDWLRGHGRLATDRTIAIDKLYDHHGIIREVDGLPQLEIGTRVQVIPNNVNSALSLRRELWARGDDGTLTRHEISGDE